MKADESATIGLTKNDKTHASEICSKTSRRFPECSRHTFTHMQNTQNLNIPDRAVDSIWTVTYLGSQQIYFEMLALRENWIENKENVELV